MRNRYIKVISFILLMFFLSSCDIRYGLVESEFDLAPESRLPQWVALPPGFSREKLGMTLTYYSYYLPPWNKIKMTVYELSPERTEIMKIIGTPSTHPFTKDTPVLKFPRYYVVTVDAMKEVFEQKEMNNILYITDDPKIVGVIKGK